MSTSPTPRGVTPSRSRDHNRQLVLGHLHAAGALGRAELARRSGLSTQAVSNIIAELKADGFLIERGVKHGQRGLPAMQYAMDPDGGFAFGVEVRPGAMLAALLDLKGQPVWHVRRPLHAATPDAITATLPELRAAALAHRPAAKDRLLGAGVALPGPFGATGIGGDLPGWADVNAAALFSDALSVDQVLVENDANAAAIAERVALAPEGITTFACLYFGTGLGLAIVQDGRLVRGAYGNAGEIGHVPVATNDGPKALEDCISRRAVEAHMAAAGRTVREMQDLEAAYIEGDPDLAEWIDSTTAPLEQAIALIENLLDPQVIVLCGAMPELIVQQIAERVTLPAHSVSRRPGAATALRVGRCHRDAAALGAAALVLNRTITPALAA